MTEFAAQFAAAIVAVIAAMSSIVVPSEPSRPHAEATRPHAEAAPGPELEVALEVALEGELVPGPVRGDSSPPAVEYPITVTFFDPAVGDVVTTVQSGPGEFGPWRCTRPDGSEMVYGGVMPAFTDGTVCEPELAG